MSEPILLAQLSWPETREVLKTNAIVLLPVGAHEQHGPGIAVSTDTISADGLCRRAAAIMGARAAVAPVLPYGVSWQHLNFPGTISLTPETLTALILEIVTSLARHGFPRVAVVNGHGGNTAAVATAVDAARQHIAGVRVLGLYGYGFIAEHARALLPPEALGHGGGDEAAVVMAEAPAYAKPAAFAAPELHPAMTALSEQLRPYGAVAGVYYDELTANGAGGDTRAATAVVGHAMPPRRWSDTRSSTAPPRPSRACWTPSSLRRLPQCDMEAG